MADAGVSGAGTHECRMPERVNAWWRVTDAGGGRREACDGCGKPISGRGSGWKRDGYERVLREV